MMWQRGLSGGFCVVVGFAAAWVWGQGLQRHAHKDGQLDAAFVGRGTERPNQKLLALVRHDPHAGAFRRTTDKDKINLISQAGVTCVGIVTKAVVTPQQPVVPGQASLQAKSVTYWWTPAPGQETYPGYLQLGADYCNVGVQVQAATTKTLLATFSIKADKGRQILIAVIPSEGSWNLGHTVTTDDGAQTLSVTFTPPEPGTYMLLLEPQDPLSWTFYSAEISVVK
jgi:hypothetical protein